MTTTDRLGGVRASLAFKAPCRVATTANITLSGYQTIDGVTLASGDDNLRVLVKNQTTASENGIYDAGSGAWTRARDCDGLNDIVMGTLVYVPNGSTQASIYQVTTADPITIGTSSLTFALFTTDVALISAIGAVSDTGFLAIDGGTTAAARTLTGTTNRITITNGTGSGGNPTFDVGANIIDKTEANTYTAGAKQTFSHSATTAGFNIGPVAGDPSSPANGDIWYNSSTGEFKKRENGSTSLLGALSGSGTVSSVAMTVPSILSVSGSPISTSGTLAVTLANQTANTVLAGPTTGSAAAPTFRALVAADLPGAANALSGLTSTKGDLIVGGPSSAFVDLAVGNDGEILVSRSGATNGVEWQVRTQPTIQTFTASGTWTRPTNCRRIRVTAIGGGGGGAGSTASISAAGGGAGAHATVWITVGNTDGTAVSGFASIAVTIGAGGAGGATGVAGSAGGTTSFGSHLSCTGGAGGGVGTAVLAKASYGGLGGTSSKSASASGVVGTYGATGQNGFNISTSAYFSGSGASSPYGAGGRGRADASADGMAGEAASGFGAGGGGGGGANAGGAGSGGFLIVEEFY